MPGHNFDIFIFIVILISDNSHVAWQPYFMDVEASAEVEHGERDVVFGCQLR